MIALFVGFISLLVAVVSGYLLTTDAKFRGVLFILVIAGLLVSEFAFWAAPHYIFGD